MPDRYTSDITFIDRAEKTSSTGYYHTEAATIAYNTDPTAAGLVKNLLDATAAMSLLSETRRGSGVDVSPSTPPAIPADDQAYRSSKLIVFFYDNVTADKYTVTIPGRDPDAYNTYAGTKNVILTVSEGGEAETEAYVAAFNAGARTKAGNASTLFKIQIAGRSQG